MAGFENITAWQLAHQFVLNVYRITRAFPEAEKYGLSSQFQRAAVSVPANIAEGYKKLGRADKLRFYNMAEASLAESRYYVILSKDLGYITQEEFDEMISLAERTGITLSAYCQGVLRNDYSGKL
ncbi:MAG: four helix bundle protein [Muribaculaceae bacterium]|nr:four helix bundle protein [Muribaculaceae bacterium]